MTENDTLMYSIQINATKEAVWAELTKTDSPQAAFWNTVLHTTGLQPGATYQMRSPDGKYVNTMGTIEEYEPHTRLVQTLRFVRYDEPPCTVTYEIDDAPEGGVTLTVRVDGPAPKDSKTMKGLEGGGGFAWIVKTVKRIVEDGQAPFATRAMYRVAQVLAPIMEPKSTRVEHWPME